MLESTGMRVAEVDEAAPEAMTPEAIRARKAAAKATPTTERKAGAVGQRLYRVVWRWHFYAGVIVAPVLVVMSLTGGIYIFKAEVEEFARRDLVFVQPKGEPIGYQAQVDAAVKANPGFNPGQITVHNDPNRATVVTLRPAAKAGDGPPSREDFRRQLQVFVDPYDGRILGSETSESGVGEFFHVILSIHRTLWAGTTGRVVTELSTSWSIILMATGLYLWWPKKKAKAPGVWTVRWKAKPYTLLRDLHSVAGFYLLPICATILVTGMFYTWVLGTFITDRAHEMVGDPPPSRGPRTKAAATKGAVARKSDSPEASGRGQGQERKPRPAEVASAPSLPLDELVKSVRERYPDRIVTASLSEARGRGGPGPAAPANAMRIGAGNDYNRTYGPMVNSELQVDKATGKVLSKKDNSETGYFWHAWTYPLHVGSFWGMTTKIPWLIACLMLTALPVTGLWMWWKRRPRGQTGLPRRPDVRVPRWLVATIAGLCVVLPVMGASVVLILLGEWGVALIRRLRRGPAPSAA